MKVVILGCGRSGSALALQLSTGGHEVTMIERNPSSLRRLGDTPPCRVVIGNGLDEDSLVKAGIQEADAFFSLTRGDNTNLMAAQVVRIKYKVPRVCVKVADAQRAEAYRRMGLFCLNASAMMAGMCLDWLLDKPYKPIDEYNVLLKELEF